MSGNDGNGGMILSFSSSSSCPAFLHDLNSDQTWCDLSSTPSPPLLFFSSYFFLLSFSSTFSLSNPQHPCLCILYMQLFLFWVFPAFSFTSSCLQVSLSKTPSLHPPTFTLFVLLQSDLPYLLLPSVTPLSFSPSFLPVSHQAKPT